MISKVPLYCECTDNSCPGLHNDHRTFFKCVSNFNPRCCCGECIYVKWYMPPRPPWINCAGRVLNLLLQMKITVYTKKKRIKDQDGWTTMKRVHGYMYRIFMLPKDVIKYLVMENFRAKMYCCHECESILIASPTLDSFASLQ